MVMVQTSCPAICGTGRRGSPLNYHAELECGAARTARSHRQLSSAPDCVLDVKMRAHGVAVAQHIGRLGTSCSSRARSLCRQGSPGRLDYVLKPLTPPPRRTSAPHASGGPARAAIEVLLQNCRAARPAARPRTPLDPRAAGPRAAHRGGRRPDNLRSDTRHSSRGATRWPAAEAWCARR